MARNSRGNGDSSAGILAFILMAIVLMPIAGLYLIIKGEDENQQLIGFVLIVIFVVFWIASKG